MSEAAGPQIQPKSSVALRKGTAEVPAETQSRSSEGRSVRKERRPLTMVANAESLLAVLEGSERMAERQRAAQALGDMALRSPSHMFSPEHRERIDTISRKMLASAAGDVPEARSDASLQLQRLWTLAADVLVESVDSESVPVAETAATCLVLMRDESIVRKLIEKTRGADRQRTKLLCLVALGRMRERNDTIVNDRTVMGAAGSKEIADSIIVPFLREFIERQQSPEVKECARRALDQLSRS